MSREAKPPSDSRFSVIGMEERAGGVKIDHGQECLRRLGLRVWLRLRIIPR